MKQSTLGSYIRSLRTQNQMTQFQLAEKLNVTDKAVSKWERDLSYPDIALFPKLADILGVNVSDILSECIDDDQPSRLVQIIEMSRDIRTPLHIILGCANLAEKHYEDKEKVLRYLEDIRISGEYLLKSIESMSQVVHRMQNSNSNAGSEDIGELEKYFRSIADARNTCFESYDFSGKRILVAEDMAINREIAGEMLRQTGAEIEFAVDGQYCVDKVMDHPADYYDLILMDIMMPNMDGLEATEKIRSLEDSGKASIPIIAVSANVQEKEKNAAMKAGMNGFTEKPIFIDKLFETMKQYL